MGQFKVHTKKPRIEGRAIEVHGSVVTFNGQKIDTVGAVQIDGRADGYWELVLRVAVDPATLFETQD